MSAVVTYSSSLPSSGTSRSVFGRILDGIIESRQREAEERIARFLERRGVDTLSDDAERHITTLL